MNRWLVWLVIWPSAVWLGYSIPRQGPTPATLRPTGLVALSSCGIIRTIVVVTSDGRAHDLPNPTAAQVRALDAAISDREQKIVFTLPCVVTT